MKKIEVKWISRNEDGSYTVWKEKPVMVNGTYDGGCKIIQYDAAPWERLNVNLKRGGLVKVILERKY